MLPLTVLLALPTPSFAGDNLQAELVGIARDIKKVLQDHNETAVAIGQFTGPPTLSTSAGPGIAQRLITELKKLDIEVRHHAAFGIEGKYTDATDKESDALTVALYVWMVDRRGNEVYKKGHSVFGDSALASLLNWTGDLPSKGDRDQRDRAFARNLDSPRVTIADGRVKTSADSPFSLEVLVGGEARAAENNDGMAFVKLKRDEVYTVRLTNDADYEAAVQISIDGISLFAFSEVKNEKGEPRYTHIIIPPHKSVVVPGWHINNKESDSFQVVEFGKSEAAKLLKSSANVGALTAVFSACWEKNADPPADEPTAYAKYSRSADATGRGPRIEQQYSEVQRAFGVVRSSITVRYSKP